MAYLPLSTANLPDPVIDPAQGASPEDYFGTLIWAGTGGNRTIADGESGVTGSVNFTPDFIWTKSRTSASSHMAYDTVRGFGDSSELSPNQTIAEGGDNGDLYGYVSGNTSGGFTTVAGSTNADLTNTSGRNYVAWNWKAGTSFSNSAGTNGATVASNGSVNTTSGFSIVRFNSGASGTQSFKHGLDQRPDLCIFKEKDSGGAGDHWVVWEGVALNPAQSYGYLNLANSFANDASQWSNTAPTPSIFTYNSGYAWSTSQEMIAYCFHSVDGFSKFGSYVGNGGGGGTSGYDGPFVYTGFRPSFVLVKNASAGWNWIIWDAERDTYNQVNGVLQPNSANAEYDVGGYMSVDFLSNGFKIRSNDAQENGNGNTHIYMAFAENPFKYSNAR